MKSGVQGGATERGAAGAMKLFVQIFFFLKLLDAALACGGGGAGCSQGGIMAIGVLLMVAEVGVGGGTGDGNRSNGVAFVADFTSGGGGNGGFKFKDMMLLLLVLSSLFIVLFKTKIIVFNGTLDY